MSELHALPHPHAGKVVPLIQRDTVPGDESKPAAPFRVVDWADRVYGRPWREHRSLHTWLYRTRAPQLGLPLDDDRLVYGRLGPLPLLIHSREIDWSRL